MSEKTIRLNAVVKELNVGMQALIQHLAKKGHFVEAKPTTKLSEEQYQILFSAFQSDKKARDDVGQLEKPISEKTDSMVEYDNEKLKPTVVGKINLDELNFRTRPDRRPKKVVQESNINIPLIYVLSCLNVGAETFEETLKPFGFKINKIPTPIDQIIIEPKQQIKFLESATPEQKNYKGLRCSINSVDKIISYNELQEITIKHKINIYIKQATLIQFSKDFSIEPSIVVSKLSEHGINYNLNLLKQYVNIDVVFKYCELMQIEFDLVKKCIENRTNKLTINSPFLYKTVRMENSTIDDLNKKPIDANNINKIKMEIVKQPLQKIIFGSPGTGKSYTISGKENPDSYLKKLGISDEDDPNCIKTVFHPEYTYGDFMGKLLPLTDDKNNITYNFYEGHFLKSLAQSLKNYLDKEEDKIQNVVLIIDEINRGNSAAIFGTAFQLLDRDKNGFSEYEISISKMEYDRLITLIFPEFADTVIEARPKKIEKKLKDIKELSFLLNNKIKIPPNLHIIATMNTSDNSIYFMDSAFKRRWDWQFIDVTSPTEKLNQINRKLFDGSLWSDFVDNINEFIKTKCKIRKVEDKQIGYYFIKGDIISKEAIENKLLFFLWDSVFNNEKRPLEKLLSLNSNQLVTFGDFVKNSQIFIEAIKSKAYNKVNEE